MTNTQNLGTIELTTNVPYDYVKDSENHRCWVVER